MLKQYIVVQEVFEKMQSAITAAYNNGYKTIEGFDAYVDNRNVVQISAIMSTADTEQQYKVALERFAQNVTTTLEGLEEQGYSTMAAQRTLNDLRNTPIYVMLMAKNIG